MLNFIDIGKKIYNTENPREMHRLLVFIMRAYRHYPRVRKLYEFFGENKLREAIIKKNHFPLEQATRAFFYAKSTMNERARLIENHFRIMEERLKPEAFVELGTFGKYRIWASEDEDIDWYTQLVFEPGQRKEGLLSVMMNLGTEHLYQIMFWLDYDENNEPSLFIGAMQGPNMENARDIVKDMTKRSHRYRTKNLILYMTQAVARSLSMRHIYAVTNEGYYAMNHIRRDRKLKTDFSAFWEEAGGHISSDPRFYELPLVEPRKTMEEVPTRKRAVYRKRFEFQDKVDEIIAANMAKILK